MVSQAIVSKRKELGLSQSGLSELSGVPQTTISGWERGIKPTAVDLLKVASALNVTVDYLLRESGGEEGTA